MTGIIVFHALTLLLGIGVALRVISTERVSDFLGYLHTTIGITTPPVEQVRTIALIWIGSMVVIVDVCLLLLVFVASQLK